MIENSKIREVLSRKKKPRLQPFNVIMEKQIYWLCVIFRNLTSTCYPALSQFKNPIFISASRSSDVFHHLYASFAPQHEQYMCDLLLYSSFTSSPRPHTHTHLQPLSFSSQMYDFAFLVYLNIFHIIGNYSNFWGRHVLDPLNFSFCEFFKNVFLCHA